jgi:hypothetical protein
MRLIRRGTGVLVAALAVCGAGLLAQGQGQGQGMPPGGMPPQGRGRGGPPQNLQVLPKDWTGQQVQAMMRTFTTGLGVECTYCHVSREDRASDAKPEKLKARKMLQMVMAINNDFLKDFGEPDAAAAAPVAAGGPGGMQGAALPPIPMKVTCFTCHRGALKPLIAAAGGGGH